MKQARGIQLDAVIDDLNTPVCLFHEGARAVYWLGVPEDAAFRCNVYLLTDGDAGYLIDPGSRYSFDLIYRRVEQVMPASQVEGLVLSHQDPDVAASMVLWLERFPDTPVIASPRTHVLLPHYGITDYRAYDTEAHPTLTLPSGNALRFIAAPFLHFPGAIATYDEASHFLFSGDIWAALDMDWQLKVTSFEEHAAKMDLFNTEYMASNVAARGFVRQIEGLPIHAILPQHGSVLGLEHVTPALEYLRTLRCGTDLIYPDLG